ncbi:sugar MFS transporter [Lichenicola cladoniae]|uniref:Sugar MFS transporter n=1 Tax=Lichenicola cladoniae TaxID=1484109 RepID=A0A6M8HPM4_9PROT|nr:sugar MFS transporter [Lichenicola cladoniae]NPD66575.1 sugar MFS transporter [Acetobacteraceae bacterium]QKE90215.1 sugar MFS transporter [Lichenicola cladoniae]
MAVDAVKPTGEQWRPIATIGLLFFIIGFVTWLNGPLISFVQLAFTLNEVNAFLVPMVFYISYLVLALPASAILRRIGMKKGLVLALLVMAVGTYLFGQFVSLRIYAGALFGLFVLGAGLSLLQTAINPYISMIGPIEGAARRIALMGICNKFAGLLAPIVLGALVLRDMGGIADRVANAASPEARDAVLAGFAHSVFLPYLGMSALLVLAAAGIALSSLPDIDPGKSNAGGNAGSATRWPTAPNLWFGILCLFLYVGAEVMAGDAIGTYGRGFHLPLDQTKFFTSFTLAAMVVGYVVGFLLTPRFVSQERYLAGSAALGIVLTTCAALTHGYVSVLCVAALGFANAMMWPAIFPLAIRGLGVATETGSALLIMGICGGAVIPQIFVHLKQHFDFQIVFWCVMAPIYGYILFYGLIGARSILATRAAHA